MKIYFDVEDRWRTKANTAESLGTLGPLRNMGACMPELLRPQCSARQLEVDGDLSLNFNRLTIEIVRFVFPLLHRVECRPRSRGLTTKSLNRGDVAALAD